MFKLSRRDDVKNSKHKITEMVMRDKIRVLKTYTYLDAIKMVYENPELVLYRVKEEGNNYSIAIEGNVWRMYVYYKSGDERYEDTYADCPWVESISVGDECGNTLLCTISKYLVNTKWAVIEKSRDMYSDYNKEEQQITGQSYYDLLKSNLDSLEKSIKASKPSRRFMVELDSKDRIKTSLRDECISYISETDFFVEIQTDRDEEYLKSIDGVKSVEKSIIIG